MKRRNSCAILALSALMLCSCGADTPVIWQVEFDSRGGSDVPAQLVRNGNKASKPTDPVYEGYKFVGWFKDEAAVTPFSFETTITANWTLYAGWTAGSGPVVTSTSSDPATGISASTPAEESITYTINGMPTWVKNNDCVIFAWAWSPSDSGSWKSLDYTSDTSATFKVAEALTGFLLVRCAAGTTTPDWANKSQSDPGRIYNKTQDITCTADIYTYSCSEWVEYNG